jgi:hypothetical protein
MKTSRLVALAVALCVTSPSWAGLHVLSDFDIDFTKDKVPAGTTWSHDFHLTKEGLASSPRQKAEDAAWIQTGTIVVGREGDCPTTFDVSIFLKRTEPKCRRPTGFVRYGCDGRHWSTWYMMENNNGGVKYKCWLTLPRAAQEKFLALTLTRQNDSYDELCRWIAREHPDFFEREIPFIGYVQFRFEFDTTTPDITVTSLGMTGWWTERRPSGVELGKDWSFRLPSRSRKE